MSLFAAGEILTAARLNLLLQPGWTTHVPTWTALSGTPSSGIGNGILTSRYRRVADVADEIEWQGWLIGGSTTNWGVGAIYAFSLPVAAHADALNGATGASHCLNAATSEHAGICRLASTTTLRLVYAGADTDTSTSVGTTGPFTWGTADEMRWSIRYRPAT